MLKIRAANPEDVPLIISFIRELAEYEREPDAVRATEDDLIRDGFSASPKFRLIIAEWDGKPAGMAFFFQNYSTWQGKQGLFLEDLFVRPEFRGKRYRQSPHVSSRTGRCRGALLRDAMGSAGLEHDRHRGVSEARSSFPRALASYADHRR